jgi:hypothetical protein
MSSYDLKEIGSIIVRPRNKANLDWAKEVNRQLMMHVTGEGMGAALKTLEPFENDDIAATRRRYAVSTKDLFKRLLREEGQVFTTKGGSISYTNSKRKEKVIIDAMSNYGDGIGLRKWVETYAKPAFDTDPMGLIFMEHNDGEPYPTYKRVTSIHDYISEGRELEYVCFYIPASEIKQYGINNKGNEGCKYYRFVDEEYDRIVYVQNDVAILAPMNEGYNAELPNMWDDVPAIIISDMVQYYDTGRYESRIQVLSELGDCFLRDRSIRDLQKLYHGFAKAVEPLLRCSTCEGEGLLQGMPCPDCSQAGHDKGSGYKTRTRISDVSRFPIEILNEAGGFDFRKLFGYVTPDIASWQQQNSDLSALEQLMYITHYGTMSNATVQGYNGTQSTTETATKTLMDTLPKQMVLNNLADWAEGIETWIANKDAEYRFDESEPSVYITYGRDYILNTPEQILEVYHAMKKNGDPVSTLNEMMVKYIKSLYKGSPQKQAVELKKYNVEPFPHMGIKEVEASIYVSDLDKKRARYYVEWAKTISYEQWYSSSEAELGNLLTEYVNNIVLLQTQNT